MALGALLHTIRSLLSLLEHWIADLHGVLTGLRRGR